MRKYERDYDNVQERKISKAKRDGYNEGYDDGEKKGLKQGKKEAERKFAEDFAKSRNFTKDEYEEEFGFEILGEPRLMSKRLIDKGEEHDAIVVDEYDLGIARNYVKNKKPRPHIINERVIERVEPIHHTSAHIVGEREVIKPTQEHKLRGVTPVFEKEIVKESHVSHKAANIAPHHAVKEISLTNSHTKKHPPYSKPAQVISPRVLPNKHIRHPVPSRQ